MCYTVSFLFSLITYIQYLKKSNQLFYYLYYTFALSLLSKHGCAVIVFFFRPFIRGKLTGVNLEKVPFVLAIIAGIAASKAQQPQDITCKFSLDISGSPGVSESQFY
jgi:hypothetical protein